MTRVGVVGGGQLARMMIPAAINLDVDLCVFAQEPHSPASLAVERIGDYGDFEELWEFAKNVDVVTFDHEHVPIAHLTELQDRGVVVSPPPEALALTHSKIVMRRALESLGIPQPLWTVVKTAQEADEAAEAVGGFPCIAKLPTGGYDGKGVRIINSFADIEDWLASSEVLLEELVDFSRELAQLSARNNQGEWRAWELVETRQEGGVCASVTAPAREFSQEIVSRARDIAKLISVEFNVVGVMAVELFHCVDGRVLVNELAMRPHNSGHIFTELSRTSQFEQHLRAVVGYPLGSTELVAELGVMVNVFTEIVPERVKVALRKFPEAKLHSYGKEPRKGRKVGHISVVGHDYDVVTTIALGVSDLLRDSGYD